MSFIPDRSKPVIVQIRDLVEWLAGLEYATGTIQFTGNPSNDEVIVITDSDGVATTYTFKTVPTTATHVLIGATAEDTLANLADIINNNSGRWNNLLQPIIDPPAGVWAQLIEADGTENDDYIYLAANIAGAAANVVITTDSAVVSLTGMSGGTDITGLIVQA